jgi:hypothetical protein
MSVSRISLLGDWKISLLSQLSMAFEHSCIAVGHHRVAEAGDVYLIPGSAEHEVAH